MKRPARLQSAATWLTQYSGKNVLRGYCKQFGVDWRCAAIELKQLGVQVDPSHVQRREIAEQQLALSRKRRREAQVEDNSPECWYEYETPLEAYLAEDYAALDAMGCLTSSRTNANGKGEPS